VAVTRKKYASLAMLNAGRNNNKETRAITFMIHLLSYGTAFDFGMCHGDAKIVSLFSMPVE
jgi:hypothetical protein